MKCSCTCGEDAAGRRTRPDLSERCYRRWISYGKPDGQLPLPRNRRIRRDGTVPETPPGGDCACGGACGSPAIRPARNPVLSDSCYRRSLHAGLGGYVVPPPRAERITKPRPEPRPRPAKAARNPAAARPAAPEPAPEPPVPSFRDAEVLRRIPGETGRAQAYAAAIARGDYGGADAVCSRVEDLDAFDALLDAGLDETEATAALAGQLAGKFPDIEQGEEETAAA